MAAPQAVRLGRERWANCRHIALPATLKSQAQNNLWSRSYRFAERIGRTLGDSAMNVIIRLSAFILVCIGVQIFWNGLSALLRTVIH